MRDRMLQRLNDLKSLMVSAHAQLDELLLFLRSQPDLAEVVDIGYCCREASKIVDDLRKEFNAKQELCEKLICLSAIQRCDASAVRGTLATASPDVKMEVILPTRGTPEYEELMSHLGIPKDARNLISPSYRQMAEFVTKQIENEQPLPPGVGKPTPKYRATFRVRS